eukprot:15359396-Ditylum_brightwellii.AAC.1
MQCTILQLTSDLAAIDVPGLGRYNKPQQPGPKAFEMHIEHGICDAERKERATKKRYSRLLVEIKTSATLPPMVKVFQIAEKQSKVLLHVFSALLHL